MQVVVNYNIPWFNRRVSDTKDSKITQVLEEIINDHPDFNITAFQIIELSENDRLVAVLTKRNNE
jgi:hypothetical protein